MKMDIYNNNFNNIYNNNEMDINWRINNKEKEEGDREKTKKYRKGWGVGRRGKLTFIITTRRT